MQNIGNSKYPIVDFVPWWSSIGTACRYFFKSLSYESFRKVRWEQFKAYCYWFGPRSIYLVTFGAMAISLALAVQCITELQKFQAEDFSGALISIGLLRELGSITISLAWGARASALIAEEARRYIGNGTEDDFVDRFVLVRYLAALAMGIPLSAYGLAIGFLTGALFSPLLGVSSTADFIESAKQQIQVQDLVVYFFKLGLVNPTIAVFAGCICGRAERSPFAPVAAHAVTATLITGYLANLLVTALVYIPLRY